MGRIDTSDWVEFNLKNLCGACDRGARLIKSQRIAGTIPFVTAGFENGGIAEYINNPDMTVFENCITIDMFGNCFYRDYSFNADDNILCFAKEWQNKHVCMFIVSILNKTKYLYDYKNQYRKNNYDKQTIKLPIDADDKPNWQYMEEYMCSIETKVKASLSKLESVKNIKKHKIDTIDWGEFLVGDMFEIHPTKSYKLLNDELFDGGESPVVVNSAFNNGIGGTSSKSTTEAGNMITFSDTVNANTIFYQEYPFIGYSHIQGLYPIGQYNKYWSKESLMFFAVSFRKSALTKGFDYSNKFRKDIAIKLKVRLPIDADGNPDWQYMKDYMRSIETKVKNTLPALCSAIQYQDK